MGESKATRPPARSSRTENPVTVNVDSTQAIATRARTKTGGSAWLEFARRKLVSIAIIVAVLVIVTFLIVQLIPGDPARVVAGPDASQDQVDAIRTQLGLDAGLWQQFTTYVSNLLQGNLGTSFRSGEPVSSIIAARLPITTMIAVMAMLFVILISVPLGMFVAVACRGGRRPWLDAMFSSGTGLGGAIPEYVLGTILVVVFAITLGWFPASGTASWKSFVLPCLAVALGPACAMARIVRREAATVLNQDYMRTARGRRLPALRVYVRHALPNLLTSTLTVGGLVLAGLLGGAVVVEIVFAIPGMGQGIISAIQRRDYPVIQGIVLVLGLLATLLHLLVDVLLGLTDSRTLRSEHS